MGRGGVCARRVGGNRAAAAAAERCPIHVVPLAPRPCAAPAAPRNSSGRPPPEPRSRPATLPLKAPRPPRHWAAAVPAPGRPPQAGPSCTRAPRRARTGRRCAWAAPCLCHHPRLPGSRAALRVIVLHRQQLLAALLPEPADRPLPAEPRAAGQHLQRGSGAGWQQVPAAGTRQVRVGVGGGRGAAAQGLEHCAKAALAHLPPLVQPHAAPRRQQAVIVIQLQHDSAGGHASDGDGAAGASNAAAAASGAARSSTGPAPAAPMAAGLALRQPPGRACALPRRLLDGAPWPLACVYRGSCVAAGQQTACWWLHTHRQADVRRTRAQCSPGAGAQMCGRRPSQRRQAAGAPLPRPQAASGSLACAPPGRLQPSHP